MEIHKPCTFVLEIKPPLAVLQKICELLADRSVKMETMQLLALVDDSARLVITCALDKDRTAYVGQSLEKITGVISVDWMNLRTRPKRF